MRSLQSESINEIVAALVKATAKIDHAVLDSRNPHYDSEFASLESGINASKSALLAEGIVFIQPHDFLEDGTPVVVTTLLHTSGQWLRSYTKIINEKNNAQSQGSGISYARRYALESILNMGSRDDDGNAASAPATKPEPVTNPIKVVKQATAKAIVDPGNYICTFGKYKGKKVGDLDIYDLDNYLQFIEDDAKKKNKPIVGQVAEFVAASEFFLKSREPKQFDKGAAR